MPNPLVTTEEENLTTLVARLLDLDLKTHVAARSRKQQFDPAELEQGKLKS